MMVRHFRARYLRAMRQGLEQVMLASFEGAHIYLSEVGSFRERIETQRTTKNLRESEVKFLCKSF